MSKSSNVFSTGQGGGVFELNVQTAFLINMLIGHRFPGLPQGKAELIRFQAGSPPYNFATDDIYVELVSNSGTRHKLLVQVKHNVSFTENDETFGQVVQDAWIDFNSKNFDPRFDRFLVIKGNFSNQEYNHLVRVLDIAKFKYSYIDFLGELGTSKQKRKVFDAFKSQLINAGENQELSDEKVWRFLKCFGVVAYDFNSENSTRKNDYLYLIEKFLPDNSQQSASALWNKVFSYASKANSKGGSIDFEGIQKEVLEWIKPTIKIGFYVNFYNGNLGNKDIPLSHDYFYLDNELKKSFTEAFF